MKDENFLRLSPAGVETAVPIADQAPVFSMS